MIAILILGNSKRGASELPLLLSTFFRGNGLQILSLFGLLSLGQDDGELRPRASLPQTAVDPSFRRVVMYLFVGTKGGYNRMKIVTLLQEEPMNANKISERLQLDYKTVQHHLKILEENKMIVTSSPEGTYGSMYFLTSFVEKNFALINDIWVKFGKR